MEEVQGSVGPAICAASVPAAEMACRVDPDTSVLEGSNVLANWATDIGGTVGRGGDKKMGKAEDVLGAIAGGGGSDGAVMSARGQRQRQLHEPPPQPSPMWWASLARDTMARLPLSLSPSLLVGVSKLKLTSLNFLVLVLPCMSYL